MNFLDTLIDEGFGKNYTEPYPASTRGDTMATLFKKVLLNRYLRSEPRHKGALEQVQGYNVPMEAIADMRKENVLLGNRILNSIYFYKKFTKGKTTNPELSNPELAEPLFHKVVQHISKYDINEFDVKFTLNQSFIIKFTTASASVDLEVYFEPDEEVEIISVFKSNKELLKEYGKLNSVLTSLDQRMFEENHNESNVRHLFQISEPAFAETA